MIIGIAGGGASGKTSLARALASKSSSPICTLHLDDFWLEDQSNGPWLISPSSGGSNGRTLGEAKFRPSEVRHFNINHPDAVEVPRVLTALDRALETNAIVIIEGIFALHLEAIRERCDVRFFVDLEADVRALRKVIRNQQERGRPPEITARNYLESARAGHNQFVEPSKIHADLIVRGDADLERTAQIVLACIHGLTQNVS